MCVLKCASPDECREIWQTPLYPLARYRCPVCPFPADLSKLWL